LPEGFFGVGAAAFGAPPPMAELGGQGVVQGGVASLRRDDKTF
jgi:hypothetical protein